MPGVVGCYWELRQLQGVEELPEVVGEAAGGGLAAEWVVSGVVWLAVRELSN